MKITVETQKDRLVLHQHFMGGTIGEYKVEMTTGAGCGNSLIKLYLRDMNGDKLSAESIDCKHILTQWAEAKIAEISKKEVAGE